MVALGLALLTVTAGGQLLLIAAVAGRLRSGPPLVAVLRAHRVVPAWARSIPAATAVEVVQVTVGVTGLAVLLSAEVTSGLFVASNLATAALFAGFTGYLSVVLRRRGAVPCGCLGGDEPVRPAAIARAALFAVAPALASGLTTAPAPALGPALAPWPVRVGVLAAAILVAALAVHLINLAAALGHGRAPSVR